MPYTPNIPQAGQTLAASQPLILGNFQEINTDFATNHVALTDAVVADRGKHKVVEMPVQAADPVLIAAEGEIFTKSIAGAPQMFWKRFGGNAVQMTNADPTLVVGPPLRGKTFLPGGLLMQFGFINVAPSTATTVNFPQAFSAAPYSITVTLQKQAAGSAQPANVVETTILPASFQIWHTATGAHNVYWIAIGPS